MSSGPTPGGLARREPQGVAASGDTSVVRLSAEPPTERATWRSVAVPREHGGWGLTLEPALLGLLIAPGAAGWLVAGAALIALVARAPLRIVLVDAYRRRWLERTRVAAGLAAVELAVAMALFVFATVMARGRVWPLVAVAGPMIAGELWYDARSKGRRLAPELWGACGVSSVVALIIVVDASAWRLAVGAWMILCARSFTSVTHVRAMVMRRRHKVARSSTLAWADLAALVFAAGAVVLDTTLVPGAGALLALVAWHRLSARHDVPRPAVIGYRQLAAGLVVVLATAVGVLTATH